MLAHLRAALRWALPHISSWNCCNRQPTGLLHARRPFRRPINSFKTLQLFQNTKLLNEILQKKHAVAYQRQVVLWCGTVGVHVLAATVLTVQPTSDIVVLRRNQWLEAHCSQPSLKNISTELRYNTPPSQQWRFYRPGAKKALCHPSLTMFPLLKPTFLALVLKDVSKWNYANVPNQMKTQDFLSK